MLGLTDAHSSQPPTRSLHVSLKETLRSGFFMKMDSGHVKHVWERQLLTGTERTRGQLGKEVAFVE